MIGRALAKELVRLLKRHRPRVLKPFIDSQQVISLDSMPDNRVGAARRSEHIHVVVDEKRAEVDVRLQIQAESATTFVLMSYTIPFADPKCIQKIVNIIRDRKLQKRFIVEYLQNTSGAFNSLMDDAIDSWIEEKNLVKDQRAWVMSMGEMWRRGDG